MSHTDTLMVAKRSKKAVGKKAVIQKKRQQAE